MNRFLFILLLTTGPLCSVSQPPADSVAITTLIRCETQAYLNRDAAGQAACWASQTELSQRTSLGNGKLVVANGSHAALCRGLVTYFKQLADPERATFSHRDFRIRVRGEAAFVTFSQLMQNTTAPDSHSQQVRYLEREAGHWKIVHAGVMYYESAPDQPQANR